jgi:hypothetical protein
MWERGKVFEVVNVVGSVASIIGFAVLIISWFSASATRDPETVFWQYVWFIIALVASAAIIVFFTIWIANGLSNYPANTTLGVLVIALKVVLGLILLGLAGDGMIAAVRWTIWPHIPLGFIPIWWHEIFR